MAGNSRSFGGRGRPSADVWYTEIVNTAQSPSPGTSAAFPACGDPAWGPGFGTRSPPRRVPTRALAVRRSAATRLPAWGSSSARPTSPVNSNSPSGRTPARSAASASPSAAHHFQRGSVERPGRAPRPSARRAAPSPRRRHRAFLHFPVRWADIPGAPRGGRRGCGAPPLRNSSSPRRRPEAPPSGSARAAPPAAGAAPSSPASARPDRSRKEAGQAQPGAATAPLSTYPSMAQTEERTVRRLTGSPRAEGGGSRAAPEDRQAVPVHSPSGSEVEGEWETGAETRDAPATAAPPPSPPRKRVPASPHPAP